MQIRSTEPDANTFIMTLLTTLEKEKSTLGVKPDQGSIICENFAVSVFNRGDEEDRGGMATKSTAKIFYSASSFFDILEQFGEISVDIQEKRKYCKWKASDILNAIKEGRNPSTGPPNTQPSFPAADNNNITNANQRSIYDASPSASAPPYSNPSSSSSTFEYTSNSPNQLTSLPPPYDPNLNVNTNANTNTNWNANASYGMGMPPPPQMLPPPSYSNGAGAGPVAGYTSPPSPHHHQYQPQYQSQAPQYNTNTSSNGGGGSRPPATSKEDPRVKDAMEICSFAISALKHNEIPLAKERLLEALNRLNA